MQFLKNPLVVTSLIALVTVGVNYGLAATGVSQKLVCTLEQTQAAASAILATQPETSATSTNSY